MFYMPKIFWEYVEDGKMKAMTEGILVGSGTGHKKDYDKRVKEVGQSVKKYLKMEHAGHALYGWGFLGAQAMNLCVVLTSFHLCNEFLGGNFIWLGYYFIEELISAVIFVFLFDFFVNDFY